MTAPALVQKLPPSLDELRRASCNILRDVGLSFHLRPIRWAQCSGGQDGDYFEQTRIVPEVERRLSVVEELEAVVSTNFQGASRLRQPILQNTFTVKHADRVGQQPTKSKTI